MRGAHIEIRRLAQENAADAALYRDIRLEALRANPEAFGSTFEIENALSLSWFFDRLGTSTVFGAFSSTGLVGIAGFEIQQGQKRAHKGTLWGMYVRPDARATGVGRRLVEAVLDLACQRVELWSGSGLMRPTFNNAIVVNIAHIGSEGELGHARIQWNVTLHSTLSLRKGPLWSPNHPWSVR
jgi:GNAT superfamily N-acetyltransferase